jgi:DNA polymerase-3 subunit gamma/tau
MSYTVLARKYRPQTFDDLVGQEHVAQTLSNAIRTGRVAHAFLFTGVRGVGKTTTARLLAKALNCEKGPTPSPCNQCSPCREITQGIDLDVLEMDGASNNGVDDVRRLQESIPYRPSRDRFKIVIVDEVHMLTAGAFNAFLKTLEEPPSHVKFIFATTESHKVPITIRSRCQRYDFRLIPQPVIVARVRDILEKESLVADDEAISIVAREAAGSMRDALTLLDQIVAFGGDTLRGADVAQTLGIAGREHVHAIVRAMLLGDGAAVLRSIDELAARGLDMLHLSKQVLEYCRDLVVLKVAPKDADTLVGLVSEEREGARALTEEVDVLELERAFAALSLLVEDVGRSGTPRVVLEMGLVRLATRPPLRQVGELLARLEAIESKLGGPPSGGRERGGSRPQSPAPSSGRSSGPRASDAEARSERSDATPEHRAEPKAEAPRAPRSEAPIERPREAPPAVDARPVARAPEQKQAPKPIVQEVPAGGADALLAIWERIVGEVRDRKPALGAVLEHGTPRRVDRDKIVIAFPQGSFFGQQAKSEESRDGLAEAASVVVGGRPEVEIVLAAEVPANDTVAKLEERRRADRNKEREREALSHPAVVAAREVFPEGEGSVKVHVDE